MTSRWKKFSVIIPTCGRPEALERVLLSLNRQNFPFSDFEVIVVNDGSHDDSYEEMLKVVRGKLGYDFLYFPQDHGGRSAARNFGIKKARGERLVFIGDDIVVSPNFLREHQRLGKRNFSVLGYTRMPVSFKRNAFMSFLDKSGLQFNYKNVGISGEVDFWRFYTSNISLEKRWFKKEGFDGSFEGYGFEDTEFGYRLAKRGMKIVFNKRASAYHFHEISFQDFIERQRSIGTASFIFARKHPELKSILIKPYWPILLIASVIGYRTKILYFIRKELYWGLAGIYYKYLCYMKKAFKTNRYGQQL